MGLFETAFKKIGDGLEDLTSLDVVTFQGSVLLEGGDIPATFDNVMNAAKGSATVKVKVLASTQCKIDGDILAFYDKDITPQQAEAHADLVALGKQSRQVAVDFVKNVDGDKLDINAD